MSLNYAGYSVTIETPNKKEFYGFSSPSGNAEEDKKIAFREAMEKFMASEEFKEFTYNLMDEINFTVYTCVHTSC